MIRPLRQRHRRTWIVLVVLLPLVFFVGLIARRPAPVMSGNTKLLELLELRPSNFSPR